VKTFSYHHIRRTHINTRPHFGTFTACRMALPFSAFKSLFTSLRLPLLLCLFLAIAFISRNAEIYGDKQICNGIYLSTRPYGVFRRYFTGAYREAATPFTFYFTIKASSYNALQGVQLSFVSFVL
jgi:hypothetical protein